MEWASMAEQLHLSHKSANAMQGVGCSGVKSRFSIRQSDGRVWRLPGERCLSDCIVPSVKFGGGGLWCGVVCQELGLAS